MDPSATAGDPVVAMEDLAEPSPQAQRPGSALGSSRAGRGVILWGLEDGHAPHGATGNGFSVL